MSYIVVRNKLMPAAGVRGSLRDREPPMRNLLAWQAGGDDDEEEEDNGGGQPHRRALLGAAVADRWETEAQQQFRYYTISDPTPVEATHTHQYTQQTRHLEQQQQRQIDARNRVRGRNAPAAALADDVTYPGDDDGDTQDDRLLTAGGTENADYSTTGAAPGSASQRPPLGESLGRPSNGGGGGGGGGKPKQSRASAQERHVQRLRAARRKKAKQQGPRVYTTREMPDSTAGRKIKQAPFHTYGRGNTHPVTKQFLGGNYLKTHNLNVAKYRPASAEHPAIADTFEHALMTSKIPREQLRAISDQARIEQLREAESRLKGKHDPPEDPVYYGRAVTDITSAMRPSPPKVPVSYEPPRERLPPHHERPLREIYQGIHDVPARKEWAPAEDSLGGVDPSAVGAPEVVTWQPRHFDVERNPRYYREAPTEFLGRIPAAGILARSEDRVSDLLYVFD